MKREIKMKREMIKPAILVLLLVSVFAIIFVAMNGLAFAGAREDVVQERVETEVAEVIGDYTFEEVELLDEIYEMEETVLPVECSEFDRYVEVHFNWGPWKYDVEGDVVWYLRVYSDDGSYVRRMRLEDGSLIRFYAEGFVLPEEYTCFNDFLNRLPVHEIRVNFDSLDDSLIPLEAERYAIAPLLEGEITFTMEDITRHNLVSWPERHADDFVLQPHHLSFEEVATLVAVEIYSRLGESVDGLRGSMHFLGHGSGLEFPGGVWFGTILDPSRTEHNSGDELFMFMIDAVTGEIIQLDMTTPDNPWFG